MARYGASSIIGKHTDLVAFLKKQNVIDCNAFINYQCIVHSENLWTKTLCSDIFMKAADDVVKFI